MNTALTLVASFKRPSAFLPLLMSSVALVVIFVHLARFGPAPQRDEGTAAHLWQLLMAGQVPFVGYSLVRWTTQAPRAGLMVLAVQTVAALAAAAPVYWLSW